jgi:hypothetical protein
MPPPQPTGQGVGLPDRQQVHRAVGVKVDQHGAVQVAAPQREVIDPDHRQRPWTRIVQRPDQPQQRVAADRDAEPGSHPRTGAPHQRQTNRLQHPAQQRRAARATTDYGAVTGSAGLRARPPGRRCAHERSAGSRRPPEGSTRGFRRWWKCHPRSPQAAPSRERCRSHPIRARRPISASLAVRPHSQRALRGRTARRPERATTAATSPTATQRLRSGMWQTRPTGTRSRPFHDCWAGVQPREAPAARGRALRYR